MDVIDHEVDLMLVDSNKRFMDKSNSYCGA